VREDEQILAKIREDLNIFNAEMKNDFSYHLDRIDNCLSNFSMRGICRFLGFFFCIRFDS
jgi:hypothetical protein